MLLGDSSLMSSGDLEKQTGAKLKDKEKGQGISHGNHCRCHQNRGGRKTLENPIRVTYHYTYSTD